MLAQQTRPADLQSLGGDKELDSSWRIKQQLCNSAPDLRHLPSSLPQADFSLPDLLPKTNEQHHFLLASTIAHLDHSELAKTALTHPLLVVQEQGGFLRWVHLSM